MQTKYEYISALAEKTAKRIVRNEKEWKQYLDTAARLYKYPFKEQLLIYAQRPDAIACASVEIWNKNMHCWVNRGAKGIALIDEDAPRAKLKYIFDISDVHKAKNIGRYPKLWIMEEKHKCSVIEHLEQTYGETNRKAAFEQRIIEIADRIAEDHYNEVIPELQYVISDSSLEELDELNIALRLRESLSASIAYTILRRCGVETDYVEELNFAYIPDFNTAKVLHVLGNAVADLSKPILMDIGKAISMYNRSQDRNFENVVDRTINARYNALKRESKTQTAINHYEEPAEPEERRADYGIDISLGGRAPHA